MFWLFSTSCSEAATTSAPCYTKSPQTASPQGLFELGANWSEDLATLYGFFWNKHRSLFDLPVTTNPHFVESAAIGGADADLIIDHQLIDTKTSIKTTLAEIGCGS